MVIVAEGRVGLSASVRVSEGAIAFGRPPSENSNSDVGTPPMIGGDVMGVSPKMRMLSMQMYSLVWLL
jgi:hypothetical protein